MTDQNHSAEPFHRELTIEPDPHAWAGAPVLVMTACDSNYLGHATALARSMDAFSGQQHLLVHVVNPTRDDIALLRNLSSSLRNMTLHISAERVVLPDADSMVPYYASARFLRMAELLADKAGRVPLFVLDADALFVGKLELDFSDKPEAEICLRRRDLKAPTADHLRVAAGAVWARDSDGAEAFMRGVAETLVERFSRGQEVWFVDQLVLLQHIEAGTGNAHVRNLKTKFSDWKMSEDAVVWTGKGESKYLDVRYLMIRYMFDDDPGRRASARRLLHEFSTIMPEKLSEGTSERIRQVEVVSKRTRCAIFLPRLDLPWKRTGLTADGRAPALAQDTVELRLWWKRFAMELARTILNRDAEPIMVEIPAWEITPERVDAEGADLAFIPHRCDIDFGPTKTPRQFYMQEYFRHVFVVDPHGWSASSSVYPVSAESLPPAVLGAWDEYRAAFKRGRLGSKFDQQMASSRRELEERRQLPEGGYIFYPLQVPNDQSIRYFSDVDQALALDSVVRVAGQVGLTLVLKEHPANRASMREFRERHHGAGILWSDANVHDLIRYSNGVVTINSGVGFEALLGMQPVVCLGRAEYDAAAHRATPQDLLEVWQHAVVEPVEERLRRYSRFVDWFLARHAIDLSRPIAGQYVLDRRVGEAIASARRRGERRV